LREGFKATRIRFKSPSLDFMKQNNVQACFIFEIRQVSM